jgi:hypothetical protein
MGTGIISLLIIEFNKWSRATFAWAGFLEGNFMTIPKILGFKSGK